MVCGRELEQSAKRVSLEVDTVCVTMVVSVLELLPHLVGDIEIEAL